MRNGTYPAVAIDAKQGLTGSKMTPYVAIKFKLIECDFEGQFLTWYGYLTDRTAKRTFESMRLCGWTGSTINDLSGITDNKVELVVEMETYEEKARAKIRWVNRYGGGELIIKDEHKMSEAQQRQYSAQFAKYIADAPVIKGVSADAPAPARTRTEDKSAGPMFDDQRDAAPVSNNPSDDNAQPPPMSDDDFFDVPPEADVPF